MRNRGRYTGLQGQQRKVELDDSIGAQQWAQEELDRTIPALRPHEDVDPTVHSDDEVAGRANQQLRRVRDEQDKS